jgi:rod shape-determining protein MreC
MTRRFSFIASSLVVAVIAAGLLLPQAWKAQLQGFALDAVSPALGLYDRARGFYDEARGGFKSLDEAQRDARGLRAENAQLATENTVFKNLEAENLRLREMLDFKKSSQYKLIACRVVSRDPSNWWNTVIINRGWADVEKMPGDLHLTSDLPVITPRGVVGKTGIVSRNTTEVVLLINQNCKISAVVEGSRDQGIVVGMGAPSEGSPRIKMQYLPRNARVAIGERVFTSGLGGVFPPGLFLGTVLEAPPLSASSNFGLYREAAIDPALDLTQLDELFVVLSN